jgi:hypothetical protein
MAHEAEANEADVFGGVGQDCSSGNAFVQCVRYRDRQALACRPFSLAGSGLLAVETAVSFSAVAVSLGCS